jgi:aldose 1-epimerase
MSRGGDEYRIAHGDYEAVITQVGAGIRLVQYRGRDLALGYAAGEVRPRYRGALLAPWPNRRVDGRYELGGTTYQLDLTEPERGHALHGLVCWERFDLLDRGETWVELGHTLVPRTGYPFEVALVVRYALSDTGLTMTVTASNAGTRPAPYGVGPHPYLVAGPGRVDDWLLTLPASEVLEVTPDRLIPRDLTPANDFDFREGSRIGSTEIDHAFTSLTPNADGLVCARLTTAAGGGVECWWDPTVLPWVQVHTADLPDPALSRLGLALEPMTCPPDAFNSGTNLVVLDTGAPPHVAEWTIRAV